MGKVTNLGKSSFRVTKKELIVRSPKGSVKNPRKTRSFLEDANFENYLKGFFRCHEEWYASWSFERVWAGKDKTIANTYFKFEIRPSYVYDEIESYVADLEKLDAGLDRILKFLDRAKILPGCIGYYERLGAGTLRFQRACPEDDPKIRAAIAFVKKWIKGIFYIIRPDDIAYDYEVFG